MRLLLSVHLVFSVFISLFAMGCATSSRFSEFPPNQIARKPVLPDGVAAWGPIAARGFDADPGGFVYPLHWEQGVSEKVTLIWMPLPLQVRYQIFDSESQWLATEFALLGTTYSRDRNYNWRPSLQLDHRYRLGPHFALDSQLLFQFDIRRTSDNPVNFILGLKLLPKVQLTSNWMIGAGFSVWRETGETPGPYLGAMPSDVNGPTALGSRWRLPLEFETRWQFRPQWEIHLKSQIFTVGYPPGYFGWPMYLTLWHYW